VNVNTLELEWGKATAPWQAKLDCQKDFEKNWMPFSYKGIDYICYDLEPLTIYQYDWVKGKQVKNGPEVVEDWRQNTKAFEQMRKFFNKADAKFSGGTPGIFLQEFDYVDSTGSFHFVEWLFVGHIWINHSPTGAGEYKAPDRKKDIHLKKQHNTWHQDYPKQYVAFYFTITLETKSGKFFIDRVSRGVGMPNAKYEPTKIIFPTGLVRLSEELFLVTYGEADCYCRKYVVKKSDLDHLLQKSGTFAEDEKHLFLRARGLAYDNMHWTPSPLDKFNLIMKPSDLVLDGIQAEKLQVKHLTGDDNQAFHFKNNAGGKGQMEKLASTTFQIVPAHTGGNKFVSFDSASSELKLVNNTNQYTGFHLLPQEDGSVRIKSASHDLYVTAYRLKYTSKVYMNKLIVPPNEELYQKFWLVPYGEVDHGKD